METPNKYPNRDIWFDCRRFNQSQLPSYIRTWILDMGSLTERLINTSNHNFEVQVLSQGWSRPRRNESQLLGLEPREMALVRETALLCHGVPWVFARSIIPLPILSGRLRYLRKYKNKPLGHLLFRDPYLHRSPYQLAAIDPGELPNCLDLVEAPTLWGRRSCFFLKDKPLLVSEIFLPSFKPSSNSHCYGKPSDD